MIRSFLKLAFKLLPAYVQNNLKHYRNKVQRDGIIREWENSGRPLPPPHQYKQVIIESYQKEYDYTTLVETGTFFGEMMDAQRNNFKKLYSIELDKTLHEDARTRFKYYNQINLFQGDSGKVLFNLVPQLHEPAIFWLDGHFSAGNTAMGETCCPVVNELEAIFNNSSLKHVILIDDARDFTRENSYPSKEELKELLAAQKVNYNLSVKDDVIRITPN